MAAVPDYLEINDMIGSIVFLGSRMRKEMKESITATNFSTSTDQVTELQLTINDPEFKFLKSGIFKERVPVDFSGYHLEVTAVETSGGNHGSGEVIVTCRSQIVGKLKRRQGTKVLKNVSPSTFVKEECKAVGAKYVIEESNVRKQVWRDTKTEGEDETASERPSSWTTFQRLAGEVGFYCFEVAGTIFFGRPTWLMNHSTGVVRAYWDSTDESLKPMTVPQCRRSIDSTDGVTVDLTLPRERAPYVRPGMRLELRGIPTFDGRYLVSAVDHPLAGAGATVNVSAKTPIDPEATGEENAGGVFSLVPNSDGTLNASQIKYYATRGGFSGEDLNVAVAVAFAESGGDVKATNKNTNGTTDYGLWQINTVHAGLLETYDWSSPADNAKMAFLIYKDAGRTFRPWYAWRDNKHLKFMDEARKASATPTGSGFNNVESFVMLCLRQAGDAYVFAAEASANDPDPDAFDCSELVEWAAGQCGLFMPDGAMNQLRFCRQKGTQINLSEGINTRGALLFRTAAYSPGDYPYHVAVSLGNGKTIEAMGRAYGVRQGEASSRRFDTAATVPGMEFGGRTFTGPQTGSSIALP